ncbi:MAG: ATP-binding cassette domain-containing protein [Oscillospiraceae bacterium]|jgi:ABC-2 type transport system ATP-binding protein|nr:ATP-binding cassette domain-containing protein [Oscillospiraceae bacterium]
MKIIKQKGGGPMALTVSGLTKRFGSNVAVDNLSFSMQEPGVYGLIGTNGAGKTTTIRMILDMLPIDAGEARWEGKPVAKSGVRFGYMPEERGIYMKTKVLEQLVYYGQLRGLGKREAARAARAWLRRLGVAEYETVIAERLSKGNQQKIQLISTLIHDPQLLFLDEPFSGLDPLNTQLFHDLLQEMAAGGKFVILSSHQMSTVEEYCREITLLHKGRALLQGNLKRIKAGYGHTRLLLEGAEETYKMARDGGLTQLETRADGAVFALPEENADQLCERLLQRMLAAGLMPLKFVLSEPTLHEIFIEKVAGEAGKGGAAA